MASVVASRLPQILEVIFKRTECRVLSRLCLTARLCLSVASCVLVFCFFASGVAVDCRVSAAVGTRNGPLGEQLRKPLESDRIAGVAGINNHDSSGTCFVCNYSFHVTTTPHFALRPLPSHSRRRWRSGRRRRDPRFGPSRRSLVNGRSSAIPCDLLSFPTRYHPGCSNLGTASSCLVLRALWLWRKCAGGAYAECGGGRTPTRAFAASGRLPLVSAITFGRAQLLHLGEHSYCIWASTAIAFGRAQLPVLGHRSSERRCRGARRLVALMLLSYSK